MDIGIQEDVFLLFGIAIKKSRFCLLRQTFILHQTFLFCYYATVLSSGVNVSRKIAFLQKKFIFIF
jgi:hypothetical protein